jgi:hypothetical protein
MSDDAKFPTILPAALADFADTLDAVGELDEAEKPARQLALQAILGFLRSAGIDKQILHRLWQQQEEIERLKRNLVQHAGAMADPLQATLFTLAHIRTAFKALRIESVPLGKLERALSDVFHGHPHPLFQPRRQGRTRDEKRLPDTDRRKRVSVCASALMQVHMDANGNDAIGAAETVARVLNDEGFQPRGAPATLETIRDWRKRICRLPAGNWERGLYNAMTRPASAIEGLLGKAVHPRARRRHAMIAEALIPLVTPWLREAIAEAQ